MKHLSEEDLVLIYYREPEVPEDAWKHLAECGQCKAAAESLAQTLNLFDEWPVPEPDRDFERRVWTDRPRSWLTPRVWIGVAAAAAVLLLIGAFQLGRVTKSPSPSLTTGLSSQARERILAISLADHLERAGIVLTEISHGGDFAAERSRAHDLVEEGRLMQQSLARDAVSPTLTFLDQLERILLEVANAPDSLTPREIRQLQERIASGSIIFKVRIIESNLRTEGQKS